MAYHKGRKVRITHGLLKGRDAVVLSHAKKGHRIIYLLKVEGWAYPYHIRGGYIRAIYRR